MEGHGYSSVVKLLPSICEALSSTNLWNIYPLLPQKGKKLFLYGLQRWLNEKRHLLSNLTPVFIKITQILLFLYSLYMKLYVFFLGGGLHSQFKAPLRFMCAVMWIRYLFHFIVETYTYLCFHTLIDIWVSRFWTLKWCFCEPCSMLLAVGIYVYTLDIYPEEDCLTVCHV